MMTKLEDLVKEGWEQKGEYAGYLIYGKEGERMLYNPQKQEVYLKYDLKPEVAECEEEVIEEVEQGPNQLCLYQRVH